MGFYNHKKNKPKVLIFLAFIIVVVASILSINVIRKIYLPNIDVSDRSNGYLNIPTGSKFSDVTKLLIEKRYLIKKESFEWLAKKKKYSNHIKPGRYRLKDRMSNNELIRLLRSGKQEPVKISFHNIRKIDQVAGIAGKHLEADSILVLKLFQADTFLNNYGFDSKTAIAMIIPNTYEFFWNTNAEDFIKRMFKEYNKFWNYQRDEKAKEIGMTRVQVMTLASIVEEETNIDSEYPIIAGLYINRLRRDMPLQADPTVKFALGDFSLKRLLHKHTEFKSPYNSYIYKGLPPGPISMPSIKAIDGVLNYTNHNYLYMCANSDFSGSHVFAKTLMQHNQNAEAYQNALNKRKIYN
jgi:UPF0755 protein